MWREDENDRGGISLFGRILGDLTPAMEVVLIAILPLAVLILSIINGVVYQEFWCFLIVFVFVYNMKIGKSKYSFKKGIIIDVILVLLFATTVFASLYTLKVYGSKDSASAIYAFIRVRINEQTIVLAGSDGELVCYLAGTDVSDEMLAEFFSEKEKCTLHIETKEFDRYFYLYNGERYIAKYHINDNHEGYRIIHYDN